jgi:hypothetical protein
VFDPRTAPQNRCPINGAIAYPESFNGSRGGFGIEGRENPSFLKRRYAASSSILTVSPQGASPSGAVMAHNVGYSLGSSGKIPSPSVR